MVSIKLLASSKARKMLKPSQALRLVQSRVVTVLLSLSAAKLRHLVLRGALGGSIYAMLAFALGGCYSRPWELIGVLVRMKYVVCRAVMAYIARGCKPRFPEWTLSFEVVQSVMRCAMKSYGHRMILPASAQHVRWQSAWVGTAIGHLSCGKHGTRVEPFYHNGLEHVWVRPKSSSPSSRRLVVLYIHGGGFAVLSPRLYIYLANEFITRVTAKLREELGFDGSFHVEVLLANYRKVPEYAYPIPPQDAYCMYEYLVHVEKLSPRQIIIAGDSAGGCLALTTLLRARDQSSTQLQPLAGLLLCPFADMEVDCNEDRAPHCVITDSCQLAISKYHPRIGEASAWGDASPAHCNLEGLPPVYIQAAELDYLFPHAQSLYAKAKGDGVNDWTLDVHKNVPHVFALYPTPIMPIAHKGLDAIASFTATQFHKTLRVPDAA
ncbi:hypothetical protein Poli38472_004452 [Pythium oligandrum]|uniref:Alpha/beta hydrolase fold-3 domain-containing protein n=1 Tax=Pythium oligandrum TaxID=41045 RepID=A0A8K1FI46_PYTOL|nr:hypothetical protein Poli38472_004452 [Pythium oligandrum]|eukprot:TMW59383.1 hypothetical protein Poli38472_004452 [Pythium oligandrum]